MKYFPILMMAVVLSVRCSYSGDIEFDLAHESQRLRCGAFALTICASSMLPDRAPKYHSIDLWFPSQELASFGDLQRAASRLGLQSAAVDWKGATPMIPRGTTAILSVRLAGRPHFVAAAAVRGHRIYVVDWEGGGWMPMEKLRQEYEWHGEAIHLFPSSRDHLFFWGRVYFIQAIAGLTVAVVAGVFFRRIGAARRLRACVPRFNAKLLLCVSLVAVVSMSGCGRPDGKEITVSPLEHSVDFHDAVDGKKDVIFTITNSSQREVRLQNVTTDCGCTDVVAPGDGRIPPGQNLSVRVTAKPPRTGTKRSRVVFFINDGTVVQHLLRTVRLRGNEVKAPRFVRVPREYQMSSDEPTRTIWIHALEKQKSKPQVIRVSSDASWLEVRLGKTREEKSVYPGLVNRAYAIDLTLNDGVEQGRLRNAIDITTRECGKFRIDIERNTPAPIRLYPQTIVFRRSDQSPTEKDFTIVNDVGSAEGEFTSVRPWPAGIRVTEVSDRHEHGVREQRFQIRFDPKKSTWKRATVSFRPKTSTERSCHLQLFATD